MLECGNIYFMPACNISGGNTQVYRGNIIGNIEELELD
jgi:hypothetical protein